MKRLSKHPPLPVLLVDGDVDLLENTRSLLETNGITNLLLCTRGEEAKAVLSRRKIWAAVLDLKAPGFSGEELLHKILQDDPLLPVIIVTARDDMNSAVRCMEVGAFDYLLKPTMTAERLLGSLKRAIEIRELQYVVARLKKRILSESLEHPEYFFSIISNNAAMRSIFQYIEAVAITSQPVLVTGETGVGKELIAQAVHRASKRKGAFVPVNVAGLDDNLFADTLFGHVAGAFTGAHRARKGLIEKAAAGTLFLDEIGDLSPASQVKLLRLLQEREYFPLGQDQVRRSDARIIVATNADLESRQEAGNFRKDLYYRLLTHHIQIPPLKERLDDLPFLVDHFLDEAAKELQKTKPTVPQEIYSLLGTYHFPGNVRELWGMVYDAVSRHRSGKLSLKVFRRHIGQTRKTAGGLGRKAMPKDRSLVVFSERLPTLKDMSSMLVDEAMKRSGGNQSTASHLLGITPQALSSRLRRRRE